MKLKSLIKSFVHAFSGIVYAYKHEQNFRIEIVVSLIVIVLSFVFDIARIEFIVILLLISFVLILELLNSALELLVDLLKPRLHNKIGFIKDIMAGVVLMASFSSVIIGIIIFSPYFIELFT